MLAETTALVVAHRPSTVLLADRVALLRDGVIAAVGTHPDLLATSARLPGADESRGPGGHQRRTGGIMTAATWRGVAAENVDDVNASLATLLRRRARRLLGSLLRPQRGRVAGDAAAHHGWRNLAALAGAVAGRRRHRPGIPPLLDGGSLGRWPWPSPASLVAVVAQMLATAAYIVRGRPGRRRASCSDLRRRVFPTPSG